VAINRIRSAGTSVANAFDAPRRRGIDHFALGANEVVRDRSGDSRLFGAASTGG